MYCQSRQIKNVIMNTQTKAAQIGVITYKKYTENVIIDNSFDTNALYQIMDNDPDFVSFHIEGTPVVINGTVTVKKEVEILQTTYNAFAKNPYTHKSKTTWTLSSGGYYNTKKQADERAEFENNRNRRLIERAKSNFKQNYYAA